MKTQRTGAIGFVEAARFSGGQLFDFFTDGVVHAVVHEDNGWSAPGCKTKKTRRPVEKNYLVDLAEKRSKFRRPISGEEEDKWERAHSPWMEGRGTTTPFP
jgi:hypothetical protein